MNVIVNESSSGSMICPKSMQSSMPAGRCYGADCMAWRQVPNENGVGYCGMGGPQLELMPKMAEEVVRGGKGAFLMLAHVARRAEVADAMRKKADALHPIMSDEEIREFSRQSWSKQAAKDKMLAEELRRGRENA